MSLKELFTSEVNVKLILQNLLALSPHLDTNTEEFFVIYNKIVSAVFNFESKRLKHLHPKDANTLINEIAVKELHKYFQKQQPIQKELNLIITDKPLKVDIRSVSEVIIENVYIYKHPYNITSDNNTLVLNVKDVEYFINIPEGQYNPETLIKTIQDEIFDVLQGFRCYISPNTCKFNIESTENFDIVDKSSILGVLGFAGVHENSSLYTSEFPMKLIHDDKIEYSVILSQGVEEEVLKFYVFLKDTMAIQCHNVSYKKIFNPPISVETIEVIDSYNHYGYPQYLQIELKYLTT